MKKLFYVFVVLSSVGSLGFLKQTPLFCCVESGADVDFEWVSTISQDLFSLEGSLLGARRSV
jgi:hypothetical protein